MFGLFGDLLIASVLVALLIAWEITFVSRKGFGTLWAEVRGKHSLPGRTSDDGPAAGAGEPERNVVPPAATVPPRTEKEKPAGTGTRTSVVEAGTRTTTDETETRPVAPLIVGDEQKSFTVDRFQFRRAGSAWECREVVYEQGKRKRVYLAYLSRATYDELRQGCATRDELNDKLRAWAEARQAEKA